MELPLPAQCSFLLTSAVGSNFFLEQVLLCTFSTWVISNPLYRIKKTHSSVSYRLTANMSFHPSGLGRTRYLTASKYLCFIITRKTAGFMVFLLLNKSAAIVW